MASEDLFPQELTEEQDLELEQAMETEPVDSEQTEEPPEELEAEETEKEFPSENGTDSTTDKPATNGVKPTDHESDSKITHLPLARIRNIMKLDPDLHMANIEAVVTLTKAVELFVASLARESYTYTAQAKKKTIQKRDVEMAISAVDSLMFLDGAMNF
ncbi:hypothetical protein KR074_011395 [Drosophila pseudoananassae]|nr:hypothetical protein KR074_011395 [Drosophila pseudoananassae]